MKKRWVSLFTIIIALSLISSCATQLRKEPIPPEVAKVDSFDTWFEEVMTEIIYNLRHNTFVKNRPFIIVKAEGENISSKIDPFTKEIRERMISWFLKYPEIQVVRRHPVHVFDRPYKVQELRCDRFTDYKMLMTLDLQVVDEQNKIIRIAIREIDKDSGTWARGFSFYGKVRLNETEWMQFQSPLMPDQHLKGLKYIPFTEDEKDEMAAYLARNITCISMTLLPSTNTKVYIDSSGIGPEFRDIVWFIKKQLQFCNLIDVTEDKAKAGLIFTADAKRVKENLWQFWLSTKEGKGLATYAYFRRSTPTDPVSGRWSFYLLPEKKPYGFIIISKMKNGIYVGNIFYPDGGLRIRGVIIEVKGNSLDWRFYLNNHLHTASGIILEHGDRISLTETISPSGRTMHYELIRE